MICGNQVNFTGSDSSCPSASAILFSKPSPASFEKGRLFGSAQTRKSLRETTWGHPDAAMRKKAKGKWDVT
jgi:hypothetical protein